MLIANDADGQLTCGPCAGSPFDYRCRRCGNAGRVIVAGNCYRCCVDIRLHELLANSDGQIPGQLTPLADSLLAAEKPRSVWVWLNRSTAPQLLAQIAAQQGPLTHAVLDSLRPNRAVHFVRRMLIDTGVLPDRMDHLHRIDPWLDVLLENRPSAQVRLVRPYAQWHLLHRARRRAQRRGDSAGSAYSLRETIYITLEFLDWIDHRDVELASLTQHDIDAIRGDGSKIEMAKIGLTVDAFQIQSIDDMKLGYIAAMAAPHNAAIQRQAQIAQAQADMASAEADQQSKRAQAQYLRQTTIVQAQLASEVAVAQAKANQDAAEAEQQAVRATAEFTRQTRIVQAQYDSEISVATARANQAAAQAEQESQRAQAEFSRLTAIVRAKAKAEVDKAKSEASQAGPLSQATAQRDVLAAQTESTTRNAALRQQQLIAEVIKPAEAEAERIRVLAQADAERTRIQTEAAASNNRVSLDQLLIEQLPQIVREAAQDLAKANVTVLNGSDGLGDIAAGLVSQGLSIFDSVRNNVGRGSPTDVAPKSIKP